VGLSVTATAHPRPLAPQIRGRVPARRGDADPTATDRIARVHRPRPWCADPAHPAALAVEGARRAAPGTNNPGAPGRSEGRGRGAHTFRGPKVRGLPSLRLRYFPTSPASRFSG